MTTTPKTVRSELSMDMSSDKGGKPKGADTKISKLGDGEPLEKMKKRTHSEVSETSLEELGFIHQQLETLSTDLKETKESMKNLMTKDDIESFIKLTVNSVLEGMEAKIKAMVEDEVKDVKEKMTDQLIEINDRLDSMVFENSEIKDRLENVEKKLKKEKERTKTALEQSNYNEQFSRKNNVKIMGVEYIDNENEAILTDKVRSIIKERTEVDIKFSEIIAIHRIPSRHDPQPILVKLKNNSVKTRLMKHRKTMKQHGNKLVDDVTKKNTELISRLLKHEKIDSAWFFNGFIYGKTIEGRRYRFDLFSNIEGVISNKKEGGSEDTD